VIGPRKPLPDQHRRHVAASPIPDHRERPAIAVAAVPLDAHASGRELPQAGSGGTGQPDLTRAAPSHLRRVQAHDADDLAGNADGVTVDHLRALLRDGGEGKQESGERQRKAQRRSAT
jgi:hypothetical protein